MEFVVQGNRGLVSRIECNRERVEDHRVYGDTTYQCMLENLGDPSALRMEASRECRRVIQDVRREAWWVEEGGQERIQTRTQTRTLNSNFEFKLNLAI